MILHVPNKDNMHFANVSLFSAQNHYIITYGAIYIVRSWYNINLANIINYVKQMHKIN